MPRAAVAEGSARRERVSAFVVLLGGRERLPVPPASPRSASVSPFEVKRRIRVRSDPLCIVLDRHENG